MLTEQTFCVEQSVPNGSKFTMKAKNGRYVEYEIFDYDGFNYFYHKTKNPNGTCGMISIVRLAGMIGNGSIRFIITT